MSEDAITNLQRRVAALEARRDSRAFDEHALKSQAAQQQATEHLYAPLRSDTKPLLEMSDFTRRVAECRFSGRDPLLCWRILTGFITEANEILKRST